MNVYVESGFVLSLALQQDNHEAAEQVLHLALKIPAFSLSEPFATVHNRANGRNRLMEELRKEIRELARTQPHERMTAELRQYTIQMAQVLRANLDALETVVFELSRTCELLQLDAAVLARAAIYKTDLNLRLQDAIILTSIIIDLERTQPLGEALFVSQNAKDFDSPAIQAMLQQLQCKYLADFTNAIRFIGGR